MSNITFYPWQAALGRRFAELNSGPETLLLPNPWCPGAASLLEAAGFEALATTGAGMAFSEARPDKGLSWSELLTETGAICLATRLPVTADYQDGFVADPEHMRDAIMAVARTGAVCCSIEDVSSSEGVIFSLSQALERLCAAVEAARELPFTFTITARADNFFEGIQDIDDTLRRLQAYEDCGVSALYAPGLRTASQVEAVMKCVSAPVNVLLHSAAEFGLQELRSFGVSRVSRVSVGSYLARVALGSAVHAAKELRVNGLMEKGLALDTGRLNGLFACRSTEG